MDTNGAPSDVSAYEAKRLQRIQQNQQMLQSLGITSMAPPRKRRLQTRDADEEPAEAEPPRRSSRLQNAVVTSTAKPSELLDLETSNWKSRRPKPVSALRTVDLPVVDETQNTKTTTGKRSKQSCMLLDVDMAAFHNRWLGKQIAPKGKQTVVEGMCPQHIPSFSKMSGVLSWRNAVVLFVNVLGVSGYDNDFTETPLASASASSEPTDAEPGAVYFKWFAQARMNEDSPVIKRLKAAKQGDVAHWMDGQSPTEQLDKWPEPVLLFLRHVDGPYIYCGRLGYLGHVPEIQPLQFRWQLLDLGSLQWSKVKQLLDASNNLAEDAVVEAQ